MARNKSRCTPPLKTWHTYYDDGHTSYKIHTDQGNYVVSRSGGRGRRGPGWDVAFENVKGLAKNSGLHQRVNKDGSAESWHWVGGAVFRTAAAAAGAAEKHCKRVESGLSGVRRKRRRRK